MARRLADLCDIGGEEEDAIRYYEKVGLLPKPSRVSGQRRYGAEAIGRLRLVQVVREAGFTVAETRTFVAGFSATTPPALRWQTLAGRKLEEIDAQMRRLQHMRVLLKSGFECRCLSIDDCARIVGTALPRARGNQ